MTGGPAPAPLATAPVCVLKSRRFPLSAKEATDGGTLNALRIVEALVAEGIAVEVFTRREDGEPARERRGRMTVYRVDWQPSPVVHPMLRDQEEGASFVQGVFTHPVFWPSRYRAMHVHHWSSAVGLPEHLPPWVRVVYTPHLLAVEKGRIAGIGCPSVVLDGERRILARADTVVALSRAEADSIRELGEPRIHGPILAPNGIDPSFFHVPRRPRDPLARVQLLSIARLTVQKGLDQLLDAMAMVVDRGVDVELTIVGGSYHDPGHERDLRIRAAAPPLRGRVRLIGAVPHGDIDRWLAETDIYVQPSRYESQCIALLEAMAAGRPVIASRLDAIREYLEESRQGLMFTPGRPDELADRIESLVRTPSLAERLAGSARERVRTLTFGATQREVLAQLRRSAEGCSTGEVHDPILAARLRRHAEERAADLARSPCVSAVLLTGSVISGPVGPGSDVDLYVLVREMPCSPLAPPWRFVDDGIIENIHIMPISRLENGHALLRADHDLADWFYDNPVGDHLVRSEPLAWNDEHFRVDLIHELVAARRRPDVGRRVALRYADRANSLVGAARELLKVGAVADAHQVLRASAQQALVAALSRLGWTLRGAKKRPEIASSFLPDEPVEAALDFLLEIVGLRWLSVTATDQVCGDRLRFRLLFVGELERLAKHFESVRPLLERTVVHERNAIDYYRHAVRSYLVRGPVNHIRCLSGFHVIPGNVLGAIGQASEAPIRDFLACDVFSARFRDAWSTLAALESTRSRVDGWVTTAEAFVAYLRRACGEES